MYIQNVEIEGFKSYAQRVALSNFDPTFNAITGLNGTGKSNILDSICFVMGIKNLSHVRATNLQELVYKCGQAGVTKASVSITFHNSDPQSGPTGYEDKEFITVTRQIVIGGRSKYLINGHAAQENRVQDMFHSVQLNVNNPHFLIMQGRINQVCNMKPIEILSLLEEASGTRMYEKKKEKAVATLEKKDQKMLEIEQVLQDEILPSVEKLKGQVKEYNEWADMSSQRDRMRRWLVAHDYTSGIAMRDRCTDDANKQLAVVADAHAQRDKAAEEAAEKAAQITDLEAEKEIQAGGEIRERQTEVDQLNLRLTEESTRAKNKAETLTAEDKALKALQADLKKLGEQDLPSQLAAAEKARDKARAALDATERSVEAAVREVAGAEAGDGRDESNRSLQERLADAQNGQTAADAERQTALVCSKHLTKQLADTKKAATAKEREGGKLASDLAKQVAAVQDAEVKLSSLRFDAAELARLEGERERLGPQLRAAREEVERLAHEASGCGFRYTDPRPGFDRASVKGVVASLVRVADPSNVTALEVAAGGKLYQVVVDTEVTAKELLERGKLIKRVTIIPLNKVSVRETSSSVLSAAARLGAGKAAPALQLVGYAEDVEQAMKYTFGGVFVCQDAGTAKKLAFSREVSCRCVTLQGDDFNPSGLLTGGSRAKQGGLLARISELHAAEGRLGELTAQMRVVEEALGGMAAAAKEHKRLSQQLDLARHAHCLLQERAAGSEAAQLAGQVIALEAQLKEAGDAATAAEARTRELTEQAKSLEREIRDFASERGKRLKAAQDKLKRAKSEAEAGRKLMRAAEARALEVAAEAEGADAEIAELRAKVEAGEATVAALSAEVDALRADAAATKAKFDEAKGVLEAARMRMRECDDEIKVMEKERKKLMKAASDLEVEAKRSETKAAVATKQANEAAKHCGLLEEKYPWLLQEKDSFGTGDYDFKKYGGQKKALDEYHNLEERLKELNGRVNHQCVTKLEKAEQECKVLLDKKLIVENDRKSLVQVIEELDEKKKAAVKQTWDIVNNYFSAIFSTLLPGSDATLQPPEGQSYLDGLDMRVAFGGVWKESLTELSGGQRALLALSLILALCRFKPAPLYILDEVDSALDLNNSQNIGRMIKEHFPQSQFLVVSHKDGFFNNANIIFRTKFVDGVSTVTRTVVGAAERIASGAVGNAADRAKAVAGGGGARVRTALGVANR
ncbi:hypothetical protein FOA52_016123 [Chlamydomonas sp. UWO 241]|nr:hypothetical protein FOA52_016123 [Chlamydomonas sp. UWO 241]